MEQGFAAVCREQIPGSKVGRGRGEGAIVYLGSLRSREPRNSIATNSGRGYYSAVKFYFASIYWPAFAKPDLSLSLRPRLFDNDKLLLREKTAPPSSPAPLLLPALALCNEQHGNNTAAPPTHTRKERVEGERRE